MAKVSGLTTTITVQDSGGVARDISTDVTSVDVSTPRGTQDITGINSSAVEKLLLLADAKVTVNGVFDSAANLAHDVFKTVPTTSVNRQVVITYPGAKVMTMTVVFSDYQVKRSAKGELLFTAVGEQAITTAPTWS